MARTKGERALDSQNRLIAKLEDVESLLREQNRSVSASAGSLRRLLTAEKKRRDLIRKELDRQRGKPGR
jgi:hypothetical protein